MIRHELAVEELAARAAQRGNQPRQRHLRGIGHAAEHRFAAEHPVEPDPVKPADQLWHAIFASLPAFDRMRLPFGVKRAVAGGDTAADPGIGALATGRGTAVQYRLERCVAGHGEAPSPQGAGQRARAAEPAQRQDSAQSRFDPEHFRIVTAIRHREYPAAIGEHEELAIDNLARRVHPPILARKAPRCKSLRRSTGYRDHGVRGAGRIAAFGRLPSCAWAFRGRLPAGV